MHGQVHSRRRVRRHRDVEKERRVRLEKQAIKRRIERRRALLAQVLLHRALLGQLRQRREYAHQRARVVGCRRVVVVGARRYPPK